MMLTMNGGDVSEFDSSESGSYVYEDETIDPDADGADSDGGDDAFDVHARETGEDESGVDIDPSAFHSDEAYARALQDAEERLMAAHLMALAGMEAGKELQFGISA